jgi:phosphate:Na+ symporter
VLDPSAPTRALRGSAPSSLERQPYRRKTLEGVGSEQHLDAAIAKLDAVRWLHRTAYHAWRIAHNLHTAEESPGEEIPARAELDPSETEDI